MQVQRETAAAIRYRHCSAGERPGSIAGILVADEKSNLIIALRFVLSERVCVLGSHFLCIKGAGSNPDNSESIFTRLLLRQTFHWHWLESCPSKGRWGNWEAGCNSALFWFLRFPFWRFFPISYMLANAGLKPVQIYTALIFCSWDLPSLCVSIGVLWVGSWLDFPMEGAGSEAEKLACTGSLFSMKNIDHLPFLPQHWKHLGVHGRDSNESPPILELCLLFFLPTHCFQACSHWTAATLSHKGDRFSLGTAYERHLRKSWLVERDAHPADETILWHS